MNREKDKLEGKLFLDQLLKYNTDIGEKKAELSYWRKSGEFSNQSDDDTIRKRTKELEALIHALTEKKLEATRMIDEMQDPVGRAVLRRRYILGDTWSKIADGCGGMSERNAHYIHDMALFDFESIYREKCGLCHADERLAV